MINKICIFLLSLFIFINYLIYFYPRTASPQPGSLYSNLNMYRSFGTASAENDHNCLNQDLNIQLQTPFGNVLCVKLYDFLEIRNITSTAYLPHTGKSRLDGQTFAMVKLILLPFIHCRRSGSYKTHISSLCQLRNNFFSKISHKAQYYQLTLKISTKKEPLISQKSQILRFYVYSISPNCTILA